MHRQPGEQGYSSSVVTWMPRLMPYLKRQHRVFWCPDAPEDTRWDGRAPLRAILSTALPGEHATFAYGYNAWGILDFSPFGLGGHVINEFTFDLQVSAEGEVSAGRVRRPSDMIAIADSGEDENSSPGAWDELIVPLNWPAETYRQQWPGSRHRKGANVLFVDGHVEPILQSELVKPAKRMRQRWNNDNRDHCKNWLSDLPPGMPCTAQPGDIDY
jgi:prepilin-type processing-associated H-X9-DG protein